MLLRRVLLWAANCVSLGSVVIRSTRGSAPYSHTTAGVGACGDTGTRSAGGGLESWAGWRRLLSWGTCDLYPWTTRNSACARRAAQDEVRWAGHRGPGSA